MMAKRWLSLSLLTPTPRYEWLLDDGSIASGRICINSNGAARVLVVVDCEACP